MIATLTEEMLKNMKPGTIFAKGYEKNEPEGLFMVSKRRGEWLKWIACRGKGFYDWAIYLYWQEEDYTMNFTSEEFIQTNGDKISKLDALKLIKCTKEAEELFRE